jgi:ABC-type cobalt transport system substrate-binding protein
MKVDFKKLKETFLEVIIIIFIFVIILSLFDYSHWNGIEEEEDKNIIKKIFNRYYFITTTISSVGYGDINPKSYSCKLLISFLHILITIQIINLVGNFGP